MIKTWIIVVVLAGLTPEGKQDLMVFPEPVFPSSEVCIEFVQTYPRPLMEQTWSYYGPRGIEQIYCVQEDKFREYIKNPKPATLSS